MLKKTRLFCFALALFPCANHAKDTVIPLSPAETEAVDLVSKRGLMLWNYDQAAWHGTDALLKDIKDPGAVGIAGWIVTPVAQGWQVTFYAKEADRRLGVWSAIWTGSKIINPRKLDGVDRVLSAEQTRLITAKDAAPLDNLQSCSAKPFNSVVMPGDTEAAPIRVYFLTPQTDATIFPMGGHNLIEMKDGKVISQRQFTKGCIDISSPNVKKDGRKSAGLIISHLLDPTPTEIHVFTMYNAKLPVYVSTIQNNILWKTGMKGSVPQIQIIRRMK